MAMSDEHKAALAEGRRQSRALKRYLEALGTRRPGRPVTPETLTNRLEQVDVRIGDETDPLKRLDLIQQRIDIETQLAQLADAADLATLEDGFVEYAGAYSARKGISYTAWREAGVPAAVLKRAGIGRGAQ
jgi:hypothetical protein